MATAYNQTGADVSIGRILSRTFGAIRGNPGVMLGIAFLFGALPQTAISYVQQIMATPGRSATFDFGGAIAFVLVVALVSLVLRLVVQGGLVRATMTEMEDDHANFGQCVATGFSRLAPLLGIGILVGLGVGFGLLLLVVPGIIFYLMWSVAVPVTVVERRGVVDSMSRSGDLTSGARGKIFALMLIVWAVTFGAEMMSGAVATAIDGVSGVSQQIRDGLPVVALVVDAIVNTFVTVFAAAIPTALYVELREWQEGPIADTLSDIFA